MRLRLSKPVKVFLTSLVISSFLTILGFASGDLGVFGYTIIFSVFIISTPQLLMRYTRYRELKEMEEKFPLFLRDVTESLQSGMVFHQAVIACSKLEYGKFTKEVRQMANQLSWGIPLDRVLDQFSERVKQSKRLFVSTKVIRESHLSGGDVISTLEAVAENANLLEDSEKEKKSLLNQYVLLMYAVSLVFIVIVVAINNLMVPIFQVSAIGGGEALGLTNPCDVCLDIECSICGFFQGTASYLFFIDPATIGAYYTSLFFFMSLIQSMFSGLIAGQISENSIIAGVKHSLILTAIVFGAFSILIRLGLMGV